MAERNELELSALLGDAGCAPRLAIFDVDGTLTQTHELDEAWYRLAIGRVLAVTEFSTDWASYTHSSDRSIVREIGLRYRGREASAEEGEGVLAVYAEAVRGAAERGAIAAVPGAERLLQDLLGAGWSVAIATGGWALTAKLKLAAAGVVSDGVPFASSDDADPREVIIRLAAARAGATRSTRVVYVGDGRWDVISAARCGIGFVGVGAGARAEELRSAGARCVVDGYRDRAEFLRVLDRAARCGHDATGAEEARRCAGTGVRAGE